MPTVVIGNNFFAPHATITQPILSHQPFKEVTAGKSFSISANMAGIDNADKFLLKYATLLING